MRMTHKSEIQFSFTWTVSSEVLSLCLPKGVFQCLTDAAEKLQHQQQCPPGVPVCSPWMFQWREEFDPCANSMGRGYCGDVRWKTSDVCRTWETGSTELWHHLLPPTGFIILLLPFWVLKWNLFSQDLRHWALNTHINHLLICTLKASKNIPYRL